VHGQTNVQTDKQSLHLHSVLVNGAKKLKQASHIRPLPHLYQLKVRHCYSLMVSIPLCIDIINTIIYIPSDTTVFIKTINEIKITLKWRHVSALIESSSDHIQCVETGLDEYCG
jgi:hypothetical protein